MLDEPKPHTSQRTVRFYIQSDTPPEEIVDFINDLASEQVVSDDEAPGHLGEIRTLTRSIPPTSASASRARNPTSLSFFLREVKAGKRGKPFLVRREPLGNRKKLKNAAGGYRRQYGKAGFTFEVRKLPEEDAVGLWTVWQPPEQPSQTAAS